MSLCIEYNHWTDIPSFHRLHPLWMVTGDLEFHLPSIYLFLPKTIFYQSVVGLHCCVSTVQQSESAIHIYVCVCVCVRACAKSLQSCLTLCDPMVCSPPGSSVHGILQARTLGWAAMPSPRGCIYIYPIFFRFPSHLGCHRALSGVPCALQ